MRPTLLPTEEYYDSYVGNRPANPRHQPRRSRASHRHALEVGAPGTSSRRPPPNTPGGQPTPPFFRAVISNTPPGPTSLWTRFGTSMRNSGQPVPKATGYKGPAEHRLDGSAGLPSGVSRARRILRPGLGAARRRTDGGALRRPRSAAIHEPRGLLHARDPGFCSTTSSRVLRPPDCMGRACRASEDGACCAKPRPVDWIWMIISKTSCANVAGVITHALQADPISFPAMAQAVVKLAVSALPCQAISKAVP